MTQHIGIVACSAEGAALCYRTIALEGAHLMGTHDHPEVSMHTHPLARYMSCIHADDWPGVADLMLSSADKLAAAGADFLICPDNTIHQAFDLVEQRSPRPWLHIAQEVASEARRSHFKRLGVLGTRYLMEGPVYPEKLKAAGLEHRIPDAQARERINQIIMDELVNAQFTPRSLAYFQEVIRTLARPGLRCGSPGMHRDSAAGHARFLVIAHPGFNPPAGEGCGEKSRRHYLRPCRDGSLTRPAEQSSASRFREDSFHAAEISTPPRHLRDLPSAAECSGSGGDRGYAFRLR